MKPELTILISGLSWPYPDAAKLGEYAEAPALGRLRGRGTITPLSCERETWLAQCVHVERLPVAALTAQADGLQVEDGAHWLRADPVHLYAGTNGLNMAAAEVLTINLAEAEALCADLTACFAERRWQFFAPTPARWYVRVPETVDVQLMSPSQAVRGALADAMPQGEQAREWRQALNDSQVLCYAHAVNVNREAQQLPPISSVWFWGGGTWPLVSTSSWPFELTFADDALLRALVSHQGGALENAVHTFSDVLEVAPHARSILVELDGLDAPARYDDAVNWLARLKSLEETWFAPLWEAFQRGQLSRLTVVAAGERGYQLTLNAADRWRFWRRERPLSVLP